MKGKRTKLIALLLTLVILFSTFALTGCQINKDCTSGCICGKADTGEPCGCGCGSQDEPDPDGDKTLTPLINNPEKYSEIELTEEKLQAALDNALSKIDYMITSLDGKFPSQCSVDNVYSAVANKSGWTQGFWPGILWHAYELTGNAKYSSAAMELIDSFYTRIDEKIGVGHHDMGFLYSLSCVAAYMNRGDEKAKEAALMAADHLITRYNEKSGFIQAWGNVGDGDENRLIVDCLLNIPLLYWASEVTGDTKYRDIAYRHYQTTVSVAYREDGSTFHTYFFDAETGEPLRGATVQGAGDDTTWSRGQSWGMYGPLLTYTYVKDETALDAFKKAANYYLNNLPSDYVAYWDLCFGDGDYEPKDSSSAAIAVCALLESAKHLDETDPYRELYFNAAKRIMNSLIDRYTTKNIPEANGLLLHGTYSYGKNGVDEMNIWGDYFYMEALHRMIAPEWDLYW